MATKTSKLSRNIGKNLRKFRGEHSQEKFAKKLGISRGFLSDIECGSTLPSLETFVKIARKIGYTPNEIIGMNTL